MSKLIRRWAVTEGYSKGTKIEEYMYGDGTLHYGYRDKFGRPGYFADKAEAMFIVELMGMVEVKVAERG